MTETIRKQSSSQSENPENDFESWNIDEDTFPKNNILAAHIQAYDSTKRDDGTYHPEWIAPPAVDKKPFFDGGQYEIPHPYASSLYLSRLNSGTIPGSTGFIDRQCFGDEARWHVNPYKAKGFLAHIDPTTHYVVNNIQDWVDLVNMGYHEYKGPKKKMWKLPDWQKLANNKVYSVEWNKGFFDEYSNRNNYKTLYDLGVSGIPPVMFKEPQIMVIHPDAIKHTEDYDWQSRADLGSKSYMDYQEKVHRELLRDLEEASEMLKEDPHDYIAKVMYEDAKRKLDKGDNKYWDWFRRE